MDTSTFNPASSVILKPMDTDLEELQDIIRRRIESCSAEYFPSLSSARPPGVICARPQRRGRSVLFRFGVEFPDSGVTRTLIAKSRRESGHNDLTPKAIARGQAEFEQLRAAFQFFAPRSSALGVVRPVDYVPEVHVQVVEQAAGTDFGLRVRSGHPSCGVAMGRCGEWLRLFHTEVHRVRRQPWDVAQFEHRLVKRRESLVEQGVPDALLDQLLERVMRLASRVSGSDVPYSRLHGDFKLRHIWATSDGGIQVFDFGNSHDGECYADVAAFLVELWVLRLGVSWSYRAATVRSYATAFLDRYFDGAAPPDDFAVHVIEWLLKKWARRAKKWRGGSAARTVQRSLQLVGARHAIDRVYLDRWFADRIELLAEQGARGLRRT